MPARVLVRKALEIWPYDRLRIRRHVAGSLPLRRQALGPGRVGDAAAVCCELRDAGMKLPAWDTFAVGDTLLD